MKTESAKIKTMGDLREFLARAMESVESGQMDVAHASVLTKQATAITESLYAEIKGLRMRKDLNEKSKGMEIGQLGINYTRS